MNEEATQEGASIHEQILARISPPEEKEEQEITDNLSESEEISETQSDDTQDVESDPSEEEEVSQDAERAAEPQIELSELASYLGIDADKLDVDDDGAILVKTKIDGQEGFAKFNDLVKSHQLEGHLNKQNMEVVEKQKQLDARRAELEATVQSKISETEALMQLAYKELTSEYQSVDWSELRHDDPAEYAARQQDFKARQDRIAESYSKLQQEKQQQQAQQYQRLTEHLQAEDQKLYQAIEGWSKPEVAKKEFSDVMSYLSGAYGYQADELYGLRDNAGNLIQPGISDHRVVVLARKAMLYDQLQQTKPKITKQVRAAPKIVKPGAVKQVDLNVKKQQELRDKVKKSGGKQGSVAAYLMETGKV